MTKGELFEKLHSVEDLDTELRVVRIKIERLESCLQGHAIRYDQARVQTSPEDHVAKVMCNMEGLLKREKKLQIQLTRAVTETADLIDTLKRADLGDKLRGAKPCLLMHYRYTACLPWSEIATKMGYTERHCFRIHDAAIDWLSKNI